MTRPVRMIGPVGSDAYYGDGVEERRKYARTLNRLSRCVTNPKVYARAADLVEAGFAKQSLALTADGRSVDVGHPQATCFCAVGAVLRAGVDLGVLPNTRNDYGELTVGYLWPKLVRPITQAVGEKAHDKHGHHSVNSWNNRDDVTQDDVVSALRNADPSRIHNPIGSTPRYV